MYFGCTQYKQKGFAPIIIFLFIVILALLIPIPEYKEIVTACPAVYGTNAKCASKKSWVIGKPLVWRIILKITLKPPVQTHSLVATPSPRIDETSNWKIYINNKIGYIIKYPGDKFLECNIQGDTTDFNLYEKSGSNDICAAGEGSPFLIFSATTDLTKFKNTVFNDCYSVVEESRKIFSFEGKRYTNQIKNDKGHCLQVSAYAKNEVTDVFTYNGNVFHFYYYKNSDLDMINQILSTFKFLPAPVSKSPADRARNADSEITLPTSSTRR